MAKRTATTRKGKVVELYTTTEVSGGWVSYVLHRKSGFAVAVFTPAA